MQDRFPGSAVLHATLLGLVLDNTGLPELHSIPQAGAMLAEAAGSPAAEGKLAALHDWAPLPLLQSLAVVNSPGGKCVGRR